MHTFIIKSWLGHMLIIEILHVFLQYKFQLVEKIQS